MSPTYKVDFPFYVPGKQEKAEDSMAYLWRGLTVQSYCFCGVESFKPSHDKKKKKYFEHGRAISSWNFRYLLIQYECLIPRRPHE